jgi:patatin-like phospholipase/acyl hydrolase
LVRLRRPSLVYRADAVSDGGGIRGISSLLILEDIMEKIREAKGLDRVPRPCEHFDLIGGTSTGGYGNTLFIPASPPY